MVIKYFKDRLYGKRRSTHSKEKEDVYLNKEKPSPVYYTEPLSYAEVRANSVPLKHNPFLSRHTPNKVHEYGESMPFKQCGCIVDDSNNREEQTSRTEHNDNSFSSIAIVNKASNILNERCGNSHRPYYDNYTNSCD